MDQCHKCQNGAIVPIECTGSNDCQIYFCNPDTGCDSTPRPDGAPCTGDFNDCTDDFCYSGYCIHPANEEGCDDEVYCTSFTGVTTGPDRCEDKVCQGRSIPDKELPGTNFHTSIDSGQIDFGVFSVQNFIFDFDMVMDRTEVCCENLQGALKVNQEGSKTDHYNWGQVQIGVASLANKLCDKVKAISSDILTCSGSAYLKAQVAGDSNVSVTTDCCNHETNWSGGGTAAWLDTGVAGELSLKLLDYTIVQLAVSGSFTLSDQFTVSGTLVTHEEYASVDGSVTVNVLGLNMPVSERLGPYGPLIEYTSMPQLCQ
jgi:hypothetical protein